MATPLPDLAKEAFVDDDFELAVDLYTKALDLAPDNADLFADRAQANIKLGNFTEAVADSNKAIKLNPSITKAYLRKGTACMKLEEYQTAKVALEAGASLAPGDSRFIKLVKECEARIAEETISLSNAPLTSSSPSVDKTTGSTNISGLSANDGSTVAVVPPNPKYRHDYYNSPTEVVLTIFAKNIPQENVSIEFGEQILRVVIDAPGEDTFLFQTRLFAKILPEKCRYTVFTSKIEIGLSKVENITWTSLEFNEKNIISHKLSVTPGILNVKAEEDKGTGKAEKITITNEKGRLSQEEIDEDAWKQLETYVYNTIREKNKLVSADKLKGGEMDVVEEALKEALELLEEDQDAEKEDYDEMLEEVMAVCNPIISACMH